MSKVNKRISLQEAAALIPDGSSLTFSGFTIWRRPMALVYELIRRRARDLHLIEVNGGPQTEFLVGAGCVAIWESCWVGHELYGKYGANVSRRVAAKDIIVEDYSHAEMTFRMAAAAAGMPFAVSQSSLGTDIHNPEYDMLGRAGLRDGGNPRIARHKYQFVEDPFFGGGQYVLSPAPKIDVAVLSVQQVGEEGTVRVQGQHYTDPEVARAASLTIAVAEEVVPEDYLRRNSDANTIASFEVDYIVECPWNAHPTGMFGRYDVDGDFLRDFYQRTRTQEGFDAWAAEWVHGLDHLSYLEKLGWPRTLRLKANTALNYSTSVKRGQ
ncbi:CoA transferase subunit A [Geoalkalibacter halelectricus]|uniref:Acyl CoA--acetate/3-ketoacid CoA transferase subunit alpha n=1 Tax=Geoalkalibacter halelectricus TaxID=2847045 RepID=A0ABY5ZP26_9BACT|nr:CoA transferase [Geoalkalibacter halelectricus]MDO3380292.1 acyl CoA--acetate/3-ketoacid CoA transferase subunit alpha [Geoalkalibacter halelectricus]UWZ79444.1 acyl CoA--acetate/3-ketoacid CoA transferase subunit alpha [Geoalkalibacter halelectricus]